MVKSELVDTYLLTVWPPTEPRQHWSSMTPPSQTPSQSFLRRYTGYVEQFDTLLDMLTVREMLLYTAEMKRPVAEPIAEKERVVDHYIDALGLEDCKDTRIGNPLNRCAVPAMNIVDTSRQHVVTASSEPHGLNLFRKTALPSRLPRSSGSTDHASDHTCHPGRMGYKALQRPGGGATPCISYGPWGP